MANQSVEELDACFLSLAVTVMLRTYTCHACAYACWKQSRIFEPLGYSERSVGAFAGLPAALPTTGGRLPTVAAFSAIAREVPASIVPTTMRLFSVHIIILQKLSPIAWGVALIQIKI